MANRTGRSISEVMSWNDYFMNIARLASRRSKDPKCQVGACIVSDSNQVVGVGYNCMPRGRDDMLDWDNRNWKLVYVCHAELNAIVNSSRTDFTNCRMYVTRIPCNECAKLIIQSDIKEVYYIQDKNGQEAKDMFDRLEDLGFRLM